MFTAYKKYWQNYVNFQDRSTRSDYWWVILANIIIRFFFTSLIVVGLFNCINFSDTGSIFTHDAGGWLAFVGIITVLYVIYFLATLVPNISISIRRIRDTGLSPWWYSLAVVEQLPGLAIGTELNQSINQVDGTFDMTFLIIMALISLTLLIFYLLPSSKKD